jgi:hypothetical protein
MPKHWAIFDLDGTLCDCRHRVSLALEHRWKEFHAASWQDPAHEAEVRIAQAWYWAGGGVAFMTGRTEPFRRMTEDWLHRNGLLFELTIPLFMRGETDRRPSTEVKREQMLLFEATVFRAGDSVSFIMEDQDKLVAQWRELGYTCLQPRAGAF